MHLRVLSKKAPDSVNILFPELFNLLFYSGSLNQSPARKTVMDYFPKTDS